MTKQPVCFHPAMKRLLLSLILHLIPGVCLAETQTLTVLPFANHSHVAGMQWMSESFSELLEERLKSSNLNILGRDERLLAFDRMGIPYTSNLSKASLIKIGQELDAELLVLGDFASDGKQIEASASVLDLKKNFLRPLIEEKGALEEFQTLCGRLGWRILSQIDPTFTFNLDSYLRRFAVIPNVALENYVRGLVESDRARQIRYFRQADKAHPNYTKVIFQLGKLYHEERDYSTSSRWLQRLLRLDSNAWEAAFLLGLNHLYLRNYDGAVIEFQRLSHTMPLSEVYSNLGIALSLKGANEDARQALRKAIEGDAVDADYHFNLAYHLWRTGDFAAALQSSRESEALSGTDSEALFLMYKCYLALGKTEEAASAWAAAKKASPKVEAWESRKQVPDLFRIQSNFDQSSFHQLQLQIREVQEHKGEPEGSFG
jgi:Flp pilus assembly protein TadD/TolB-like protein